MTASLTSGAIAFGKRGSHEPPFPMNCLDAAKTAGPAFVWANLALVELEGGTGPYQVEHLSPARQTESKAA